MRKPWWWLGAGRLYFYRPQPQTQSVVRQHLHALAQHPPQHRPPYLIHDCIQHQNCGVSQPELSKCQNQSQM